MRIAFISAFDQPWGGSEELWSRSAVALARKGHDVVASVPWFDKPSPKVMRLAEQGVGLEYRRVPGGRFAKRWYRWRGVDLEREWLERVRPNLVVVSQATNLAGCGDMLRCRELGLPYLSLVQAAGERWWPEDGFADRLKLGYENALHCCFVSQHNLELTRKQLPSDLPRARVVRNPLNVPIEPRLPWPSGNAAAVLKMACVGRIDPTTKGQDLLVEVMADPAWRSRAATVTFFGSGPNRRTVEAYAKQLGVRDRVNFGGFVDNVSDVWRDHHVLVMPSRVEGLPLAVMEAMVCGRPAVVTDESGTAEPVDDGETGFVAIAAKKEPLGDAMEEMWQSRDLLEQMGMLAAERAKTFIGPDPVKSFVDLIELSLRQLAA